MQKRAAAAAAEREREEIRRLRERLVHKPTPVPNLGQPFVVRPSNKELTEPETPQFAKPRQKVAVRH